MTKISFVRHGFAKTNLIAIDNAEYVIYLDLLGKKFKFSNKKEHRVSVCGIGTGN